MIFQYCPAIVMTLNGSIRVKEQKKMFSSNNIYWRRSQMVCYCKWDEIINCLNNFSQMWNRFFFCLFLSLHKLILNIHIYANWWCANPSNNIKIRFNRIMFCVRYELNHINSFKQISKKKIKIKDENLHVYISVIWHMCQWVEKAF